MTARFMVQLTMRRALDAHAASCYKVIGRPVGHYAGLASHAIPSAATIPTIRRQK